MLFKNSVRTSKRTPHFTITKINWLTLFKFNHSTMTFGYTIMLSSHVFRRRSTTHQHNAAKDPKRTTGAVQRKHPRIPEVRAQITARNDMKGML